MALLVPPYWGLRVPHKRPHRTDHSLGVPLKDNDVLDYLMLSSLRVEQGCVRVSLAHVHRDGYYVRSR
jgi:hypothetical protein